MGNFQGAPLYALREHGFWWELKETSPTERTTMRQLICTEMGQMNGTDVTDVLRIGS